MVLCPKIMAATRPKAIAKKNKKKKKQKKNFYLKRRAKGDEKFLKKRVVKKIPKEKDTESRPYKASWKAINVQVHEI